MFRVIRQLPACGLRQHERARQARARAQQPQGQTRLGPVGVQEEKIRSQTVGGTEKAKSYSNFCKNICSNTYDATNCMNPFADVLMFVGKISLLWTANTAWAPELKNLVANNRTVYEGLFSVVNQCWAMKHRAQLETRLNSF